MVIVNTQEEIGSFVSTNEGEIVLSWWMFETCMSQN
jgi:hypothetical protein